MLDYLLVGSGLFSCVFASLARKHNKKCLIIEKRDHAFGNCYTKQIDGINVHKYGPHIFHTNNDKIWNFVNEYCEFSNYINRPKVKYKNRIYSFPINLMTLHQLWGVDTPEEAKKKIDSVKIKIDDPANLEEWILSQVGEEIYYTFIYGYTKKQWNTEPKNLPSFIIKRLPIRLNFDDNYFFDKYQGIPIGGYSSLLGNMTDGIEIVLNTDYFVNRPYWDSIAKKIVYTGPIDRFFDYTFGVLQYRSLLFEHQTLNIEDFQGNAIINYTEESVPFTRIIEHKHFEASQSKTTIITKEYPQDWTIHKEPFYPINNDTNNNIYNQYKQLTKQSDKFIFGGRLAEYQYYDMHQVVASAIHKYYQLNNI
jgi:UDP-galactopyranose mutase